MPQQKQLLPISFAGGVDTKTDPKQVAPSKLLALQNGILLNAGAINKRWGYTAFSRNVLGSAATIAACNALHAFNNELLLYDGQSAFSYSPSRDAWMNRGSVISVIQSNQQIIRNTSQQLSPDMATLNGIEVYAWEDSRGGIRYSVTDAQTGAYLLVDQPLFAGMPSTVARPKVLACGSYVVVLYTTVNGQVGYVQVNPNNPTLLAGSGTIVLNGLATPAFYDATATGSTLYVAYYTSTSVVVSALSLSMVWMWATTVAPIPSLPVGALNVTSDATGNAWVTYADAGTGSLTCSTAVLSSAGASVLAPVRVVSQSTGALQAIAAIIPSGSTATVYAEALGSSALNVVIYSNTVTITGTLGVPAASAPAFARSVGLASKPFVYLGAIYVNVAFQSPLQSTYFTLDASGHVVSKVNPGLAGGLVASSDFVLPESVQVSSGVFKYANLVKGLPNTEAGVVLSLLGVNATKLDFFDPNSFLSVAINGGFYTVGGVLQSYDGAQYVEHGFHVYPETFTASPIGSGGALGTGTYNYVATYEWPDNNGLTQISNTSVAVSVTFASGSSNSVSLTLPTLRLTKKSNVKVVIYRTAANGLILTRCTSAVVPLLNNPAVDTVSFTDVLSDASIASNGALYTQPLVTGGNPILPNGAPPACSLITTYADRIFLAGLDNPYKIVYSKQTTANVPMEFSDALTLSIDPDGGGISGIARMDEKLIIFKKSAIFYLIGQGPTATGDQNDFQDPISIPSGNVGCANANAIVLTPVGLMFPSANGIYLLDRNLNVSYKGAPVEGFNALSITSATLIPNQWVVFTTSQGTALVYDYFYDQWSTFTNHAANDGDLYLGNGNLFVFGMPNGRVFQQSSTLFTDAGAPVPLSLTTAWVNPGVVQGYQRIYHAYLLGTRKGTHTLSMGVGFDYDDSFVELATANVDSILGSGVFGGTSPFGTDAFFGGAGQGQSVYQFRADILRKCQAVRFQISESDLGNEAMSLSALTLVIGVKTGGNKGISPAKQIGAG